MLSKNWRMRTLRTFFQGSVKAGIHSRENLSIHRRIEANSLGGLEAILGALPKRFPAGSLRLSSVTRSTFCGPEFRHRALWPLTLHLFEALRSGLLPSIDSRALSGFT